MATSSHEPLRRIAEATKSTFALYKEGVYLEGSAQRSLEDLRHQATADRLRMARDLVRSGEKFLKMRPPEYRSAISRFYYSMYHSMRAVVYFTVSGDDHQDHGTLPKSTPTDFPDRSFWENALKNARTSRNSADYDPYPLQRNHWHSIAVDLAGETNRLLALADTYLEQKGCDHL